MTEKQKRQDLLDVKLNLWDEKTWEEIKKMKKMMLHLILFNVNKKLDEWNGML